MKGEIDKFIIMAGDFHAYFQHLTTINRKISKDIEELKNMNPVYFIDISRVCHQSNIHSKTIININQDKPSYVIIQIR